ncbi:unnamed protein product [Lactuca saligna]|uniref:Uncharacterized protein n=1 Tax=Lactuca saligna TaxID=75948 RepID=A0AA35Z530_LACSI|nr:unnamed protein product [Lactuca saligna]
MGFGGTISVIMETSYEGSGYINPSPPVLNLNPIKRGSRHPHSSLPVAANLLTPWWTIKAFEVIVDEGTTKSPDHRPFTVEAENHEDYASIAPIATDDDEPPPLLTSLHMTTLPQLSRGLSTSLTHYIHCMPHDMVVRSVPTMVAVADNEATIVNQCCCHLTQPLPPPPYATRFVTGYISQTEVFLGVFPSLGCVICGLCNLESKVSRHHHHCEVVASSSDHYLPP